MRYIDEFRDPALARRLVHNITQSSTRDLQFMEFCGGHTHAIFRFGLRQLLPPTVHLRAGPGCPVCVTSARDLERAIALAHMPQTILTTFGDMIRVPGSQGSLQEARAQGGDVRVVYSTLDALDIARQNPHERVVFLGVGFETTVPTVAAALLEAEQSHVPNFYVYSVHKLTPPATRAILDGGEVKLDGIIGPGHVTTIIGTQAWEFLPREYDMPCAVAGFEPLDILRAVAMLVKMASERQLAVGNAYERSVTAHGNPTALGMVDRVFVPDVAEWRGFGEIPESGLSIRAEYSHRDAGLTFAEELERALAGVDLSEPKGCRCGEVLRGVIEPPECTLFRRRCSPRTPIGPCMVSNEGACAAYYRYGADQ